MSDEVTHAHTYIICIRQQQHRVWPHTCTSYVLNAYLYCVYALVGGAISIRDPYICAVSRVCAKQGRRKENKSGKAIQWW